MTVIVNVAGTSGSGKSTVVRKLLEVSRDAATMYHGEKEIGSIIHIGEQSVFVAGRYGKHDTAGCDCIKDVRFWYNMIYEQAERHHVVYEGLFVMNHQRGVELMGKIHGRSSVHIINLTTPWEVCRDSINERRARRNQPGFTGDQKNLQGHMVRAKNFAFKLRQLGATVYNLDRDTAALKLRELVG